MDCHACGHALEESDTFCSHGCGRTRVVPTDAEAAGNAIDEATAAGETVLPVYDSLAVWTAPSEPHEVIANVSRRTPLRVLADAGTHLEVALPSGQTGYVVRRYVAGIPAPPAAPAPEVVALAAAALAGERAPPHDAPIAAEADTASFGRRAAGAVIDVVITGAAFFAIGLGLYALLLPDEYSQSRLDAVRIGVAIAIGALWFSYHWLGDAMGGTPGKRIVSIRVVDGVTGGDPGLATGFIRGIVRIASGLALGLGYLRAAWDAESKTWQDRAAGTSVIDTAGERHRLLVPVGAVLGAVLVGVAAVSYRDLGNGHVTSAAAHPLPTLHEFTAEQQQELHDIRDATAAMRDASANAATHEGTLTRDEYAAWVGQSYDDVTPHERERVQGFNVAFRLLHMIGPDDDLLASSQQHESTDVIGFYVFKDNALVVIGAGGALTAADDFALSHEYTHSFQAGLGATKARALADKEKDGDATEYGTTVQCIEEGDAVLTSVLWARQKFGAGWADIVDGSRAPSESATPVTSVPPALERYASFPYNECPTFVAAIYRRGGWSAVDELYRKPPTTTEQILHPEKYGDGDRAGGSKAIDLKPRLGSGWRKETLGTFGEFDVYNYLLTVLGDEQLAAQAAAGWGGGWVGVYTRDPSEGATDRGTLVHLALNWDTDQDAGEFDSAYRALIDKLAPGHAADASPVCWSLPGEFGYFAMAPGSRRADIVISNDEAALKSVATNGLATVSPPCAAWAGTN